MAGGRPNKGIAHVNKLNTDKGTKERIKAILLTIQGELTVQDAANKLGIGESRFHELRDEFLTGGAQYLEPRPQGRPAEEIDEKDREIELLQQKIVDLEINVQTARVREEIALAMPQVLQQRIESIDKTREDEKKRAKKQKKEKRQARRKHRRIRKKK